MYLCQTSGFISCSHIYTSIGEITHADWATRPHGILESLKISYMEKRKTNHMLV